MKGPLWPIETTTSLSVKVDDGSFSIDDSSHASTVRDCVGEQEQVAEKLNSIAAHIDRPMMSGLPQIMSAFHPIRTLSAHLVE